MLPELIVTFIWFGVSSIDQNYLVKLSDAGYPLRIMFNPPVNNTLAIDNTQKSNFFRLDYLKDGGIYSDWDNVINYTCMYNEIYKFNQSILLMDLPPAGNLWNGFIYVPENNTSLIRKIIEQNKQTECTPGHGCFQSSLLQKYSQNITRWYLNHCISTKYNRNDTKVVVKEESKKSMIYGQNKMSKQDMRELLKGLEKERDLLLFVFLVLFVLMVTIYVLRFVRKVQASYVKI